jgi:predicted RNA-binding Zn-ribbon protein involved in translation (DUF1610 family)
MSLIQIRYRCGHVFPVKETKPAVKCPTCGAAKVAIIAPAPTVAVAS